VSIVTRGTSTSNPRPSQVEPAVRQALAVPAAVLRENAASLRAGYLQSQSQWAGMLSPSP